MDEYKESVRRELLIDKKHLSSTVRKLTSAHDDRPSSTTVGSVGVIIISLVVLSIVMADISKLFIFIKACLK